MMETDRNKIKTEKAWKRLYSRLDNDQLIPKVQPKQESLLWLKYGAVAALVVFVFGSVWLFRGKTDGRQLPHLITQENQETPTLVKTLEDGSVVFLTKETSIHYPEHFIASKREVRLEGDAFFDVAKNANQPFLIDTKQVKIEVLGTSFSVRSLENSLFRLSVHRGIVRVTLKQGNQVCEVRAGETVELNEQKIRFTTQKTTESLNRYLSHVCFKDEALSDVVRVMNMSSDSLKLGIASPALANRKLTVEFSDEPMQSVATLIAYALNLKSIREGNLLLLTD